MTRFHAPNPDGWRLVYVGASVHLFIAGTPICGHPHTDGIPAAGFPSLPTCFACGVVWACDFSGRYAGREVAEKTGGAA